MATIKQIAKQCGVSTATVSKVFNGYSDVGEQTARAVREAAESLGYFPNAAARALKTSRAYNLGVLYIDQMQHEFFSQILESFKRQAERQGYDITFISRNIGGRLMSYLDHCRYRGCDGMLITCVDFTDPLVSALAGSGIPIVSIDHVFGNSSSVLSDNVTGMQELVTHLYERGHRKIAYIRGENYDVTHRRMAGFHRACRSLKFNVPAMYLVQAGYQNPEKSAAATRQLLELDDRPTCILYPDDFSYIGGLNELERAGLRVPLDISAAGYDGTHLSQVMRPRLTTVKQDTAAIGSTAAELLIRAIENPETDVPEQVIVSGHLLLGETVSAI
ncbi:MAG: LacI family transcriptional regulator [Oscillospiraceae bacterium]|nr:LacI family transcriptional regulator [Oscillospiraceae bacterium]